MPEENPCNTKTIVLPFGKSMFFQTGPVAIACASDNELNRCPWSTCQKRGCDSGNPNKPTQLSLPRNQLEKWPHMMTTKKIDKIHFILQRMGTSVAGGSLNNRFKNRLQQPSPCLLSLKGGFFANGIDWTNGIDWKKKTRQQSNRSLPRQWFDGTN